MRLFALLGIVTICFAPLCCADEGISLRNPVNHLLVLNSGRVVKGRLTPRTGGYDVTLDAGRMFVSSQLIRFKALDMDDAYQRMRESYAELTPNSHIELARWCIANKLNSSARRELLDVLHLDPYHTDAKRMLEGLVRERERAAKSVTPVAARIDPLAPERRSLGGLTQEMAGTFTRNIQPLISNKCGNTRCHGAGRNSFAVVSIRGGATPYTTEQNLAAVLNQINFANPERSPIMKAITQAHGGSRELFFRGQSGRRQIELLRGWITSVVDEASPTTAPSAVAQTNYKASPSMGQIETDEQSGTSSENDTRFISDAVAATKEDRFNPEVFNEKFHGLNARSGATESR